MRPATDTPESVAGEVGTVLRRVFQKRGRMSQAALSQSPSLKKGLACAASKAASAAAEGQGNWAAKIIETGRLVCLCFYCPACRAPRPRAGRS